MTDIMTFNQVTFTVGDKTIMRDVNLTVPAGEWLTIVGPSGSGKSTLLKLAATLITPTSGTITFDGQPQDAMAKPAYRQAVSYCFQQPSLFGETVRDNLTFPFTIRGVAFDEAKSKQALESVDLPATMLDTDINDLSGGEKQRVALIRNLLFPPRMLLLDEVTTGLDATTKDIVHQLITRHHDAGMTIMMVTHDETEIAAATKVLTVRAGRLEA